MDEVTRTTLLPMPSLSLRQPAPESFGDLLDFGGRTTLGDSWLSVIPVSFVMPASRPFKMMTPPLIMPLSVRRRIDVCRRLLRASLVASNTDPNEDQSHPSPDGGNGDEEGKQTGDQDQSAFGGASETLLMAGDGGGHVLEGVDEDAEGPATALDDLLLLAQVSPMWMAELRKYLWREEKERGRMQELRAARLARWREDVLA
ncbi:hypothetical protein DXG03_000292 [Asterophora parasitica]|uniref:Uncharacterized protein n=1 Tax=Asterophora parasitica TaxID=117018 RepID=A0A9P7KFV5_9AGAR|nr:hypothetical protein DXG03_000292 [Asterophora parasitica]